MKTNLLLIPLLSLALSCCGPSKAELRAELRAIDAELVHLRNAAYRFQSQMGQAEFNAFIGSFATGFGATSGDYEMAGGGMGTVVNAAGDYDVANYSLKQIRERQMELISRRMKIMNQLK